jgi:hypothetical protein
MRILLTQSREVLLDEIDYIKQAQKLWYYKKDITGGYARRVEDRKIVLLHVEIVKDMGIWIPELQVDHKNRNKLDCQRQNLRMATRQQNNANTETQRGESGYLGVRRYGTTQCWEAHIRLNRITISLGTFNCKHCAAIERDRVAINAFKEFAILNNVEPCEHRS